MRDNCYVKDLREFSEEFNMTCERMEKQNNSLTETYRNELAQIEVGALNQLYHSR